MADGDGDARRRRGGQRRVRGVLIGLGVAVGVLVVVVVLAGPMIAGSIVRSVVADAASERLRGDVSVESVELSWFGSQRVGGVTLSDPDGKRVAVVEGVSVERGLLSLVFDPVDLGMVTLRGVVLDVEVSESGESGLVRAVGASEGVEDVARERVAPPRLPAGLRFGVASADPIVVNYSVPGESGVVRLDLESGEITPGASGEVRLVARSGGGDGGGGAAAEELSVVLGFGRLVDGEGRLDVGGADVSLEVVGERVPRGFSVVASALAGGGGVGGEMRAADGDGALSVEAAFEMRGGVLRLREGAGSARVMVPVSGPLFSVLRDGSGAGLEVEGGGLAELRVSALDVPMAGLIAEVAGWEVPAGARAFDTAVVEAALEVPALEGVVYAPVVGESGEVVGRGFSSERAVFSVSASPLSDAFRVVGTMPVSLEGDGGEVGTSSGAIDVDLTASGLRTTERRVVSLEGLELRGTLDAAPLPIAAIDGFVRGVELTRLLGERGRLALEAGVGGEDDGDEGAGEAVSIGLEFSSDAGVTLVADALLGGGVLEAAGEGVVLTVERPSSAVDGVLASLGRMERLGLVGGDDEPMRVVMGSFRVPIDAAQPLTEATASFVVEAPAIGAGGGVVRVGARGSYEGGLVSVSGARGDDGVLVEVEGARGVLKALGLVDGDDRVLVVGAGDGAAGLEVVVGDAVSVNGFAVEASLGEVEEDWLRAVRSLGFVVEGSSLRLGLAGAGGEAAVFERPRVSAALSGSGVLDWRVWSERLRAGSPVADVSGEVDAAVLRRGFGEIDRSMPGISGEVSGLPVGLVGAFVDAATARSIAAGVGESARVAFETVRVNEGRAVRVVLATATAEASATVAGKVEGLVVTGGSARLGLTPEGVDGALRAIGGDGEGGGGESVELVRPAEVRVDVSDVVLPVVDGELRFAPTAGVSAVVSTDGAVRVEVLMEEGETGRVVRRELDVRGLVVNAGYELGGGGVSMPVEGRFALADAGAGGDGEELARVEVTGDLSSGLPVFVADVRGARPRAIDAWLGDAGGGAFETAFGGRLELTLASTLGLEQATGVPGDSVVVRVDSEKLVTDARLEAERGVEGELMGFALASPVDATFEMSPELFGRVVPVSQGGEGVELAETVGVRLRVGALRLGPPERLLDAGELAVDASLGASNVVLVERRAGRRRVGEGLRSGLGAERGEGGPGNRRVVLRSVEASVVRARGGDDEGLAIDVRALPAGEGEAFVVDATVTRLGEGAVIDGSVDGNVPLMLVDAVAATGGIVEALLGERARVDVVLEGVRLDRSAGGVSAMVTTPRAEASVVGRVRDGALVIEADGVGGRDGGGGVEAGVVQSGLMLTEISGAANRELISPLFPLFGLVEKSSGDEPLTVSLPPRTVDAERRFVVPLDGDLRKLNGALRVDLGAIRFAASRALGPILRATSNNERADLGASLEPVVIRFRDGVASYEGFEIPIGDVTITARTEVDLVRRTERSVYLVPIEQVSGDVADLVRRNPALSALSRVPIRVEGPLGAGRPEIALDLIGEAVGAEGLIRRGLGELLGGGREDGDRERRRGPLDDLFRDLLER